MKLDLPFYKNDGNGVQCAQVAMKIVLEYFLKKEFSLEELDSISGRKDNFYTWTTQSVATLYTLGLDVEGFSLDKIEPYLGGESYFLERFPKEDADALLSVTDIKPFQESIKICVKNKLYNECNLSLRDIEEYLESGGVPIVVVDWNKLYNEEGPYDGHMLVLTGFDENNIYYHESGPSFIEPHKKVSKKVFELAACFGTDYQDIIIVKGKREI